MKILACGTTVNNRCCGQSCKHMTSVVPRHSANIFTLTAHLTSVENMLQGIHVCMTSSDEDIRASEIEGVCCSCLASLSSAAQTL